MGSVTGGGKFIMAQIISRPALPQPISRAASTDLRFTFMKEPFFWEV